MDEHALDVEALLAEQGWLRALARRLTQDDASADDLVQETWLAALRRPPESGRPLRPWLAQVIANFAKMRARREGGVARRERAAARAEVVPDASALVERAEVQRRLARFVLDLDEPFRATVLLRYYEGLSSAEIARRSGVPAGTVRWRLMQGLERLRTHLDDEHGGERKAWCALLAPLAVERALTTGVATTALLAGAGALALAGLASVLWPLVSAPRVDLGRTAALPSASSAAPVPDAAALDAPAEREARRPVAGAPAPQGPLALELEARAVDAAGKPLAGAQLMVRNLSSAPAVSGADGRLRLSSQAPASAFEDLFTLELAHAACALRERRTALAPGRLNQLGDLVLAPGGGVGGRVVDGHEQALAGARVLLEVLPSRWQAALGSEPLEDARIFDSMLGDDVPRATTDPDGRFEFGGLAVGHVRLWAQHPGLLGDYSAPVAVRAGETSACADLVLAVAGDELCIAGRVVGPSGDHVSGAEIEVSRASTKSAFFCGEPWIVRTRAGPDGRFRAVVGAFPYYDLAVRDPSGALAPLVQRRLRAGTDGLRVRLEPPRALALDVRGPRGEVLTDARVELVDARSGRPLATSAPSAAGALAVAVPWVSFRVLVTHAGCQPADLGPFLPERAPDELKVGLEAARRLAGRVRAAGQPLAGARLELLAALPAGQHAVHGDETPDGAGLGSRLEHAPPLASAVSDAEGRFAFDGVRAGRCLVRAEAPGFAPALLGPLELSDRTRALELELTPGGALTGRALGADGAPLAGRTLGATNGDGHAQSARTDADGRYRLEHLAPGGWQVRELAQDLAAGGWAPIASAPTWLAPGEPPFDCTVAEGATTTFDVHLAEPRAALLRGRLRFAGKPPGAWLVLLARAGDVPGPGMPAGLDAGLDADGRFELRVPAPGRYRLSLWNTGLLPLAVSVHDTLELVAGQNAWELDLPTSELTLTGVPSPKEGEHQYYLWEGAGELYCATLLTPAADGPLVLPQAPAGVGRIVRVKGPFGITDPRPGRTLKRVVLEAGTAQTLRLP